MQILTVPGSIAEINVHYLLDPANHMPPLLPHSTPPIKPTRRLVSQKKIRACFALQSSPGRKRILAGMNYFLVRPLEALGAGEDVIALASSRCLILRSVVTLIFLAP
jgi:hypothetical protein